jgi:hypothetical protein
MEHNVKCKNYFYDIDYNRLWIDVFVLDEFNGEGYTPKYFVEKLNGRIVEARMNEAYKDFVLVRILLPFYKDPSKLDDLIKQVEDAATSMDKCLTIKYGAAYLECKHDVYLMFVESEKEKTNETNGGTVS